MKEAVQEILAHLGIDNRLSFQDVQEVGLFRLLFGRAPLNHIGRGVGHVLPVIVAGLLGDPLLGQRLGESSEMSRDEYLGRCPMAPCLAHEELESPSLASPPPRLPVNPSPSLSLPLPPFCPIS